MRILAWLLLIGLSCNAARCSDACTALAEESCRIHGDDSLACMSSERELSTLPSEKQRLCEKALILYRSNAAGEPAR